MELLYSSLLPAMWMAWALCWWLLSRNVKATARRETLSSRLGHILPLMAAGLLIWLRRLPIPPLEAHVFPEAEWLFWAGAAMTASGLSFAVWARLHLGMNWSGTVTIKQGHELITSGPYALVRHPIYTGLLLAFAGSALARDEWRGVLAVALAFWSLWRKLRIEERWMREQFGEAYQAYSQRVSALVPFVV